MNDQCPAMSSARKPLSQRHDSKNMTRRVAKTFESAVFQYRPGLSSSHSPLDLTAPIVSQPREPKVIPCCSRDGYLDSRPLGEMAERLNAPVLKTGVPVRVPRVRIPLSPLDHSVTTGDRLRQLLSPVVFLIVDFVALVTASAPC